MFQRKSARKTEGQGTRERFIDLLADITLPTYICFSPQQHESLEKQNHALRKEIQALQAELACWTQALHVHERLCLLDCASCLAPGAAGCWDQAEQPPGSVPHGQHGCQEQLGLFRTPVSSPSAPQPSPDPQPHGFQRPAVLPVASRAPPLRWAGEEAAEAELMAALRAGRGAGWSLRGWRALWGGRWVCPRAPGAPTTESRSPRAQALQQDELRW